MEKELPRGWVQSTVHNVTTILDSERKPVSAIERAKRVGDIPYYGATGQAGWINDFLFNEELVLLGEDGAPFFDFKKDVAYIIKGKSWVNNHAHVLKALKNITTNKFLLYFLNQFDYHGFVGGTTRLKLTQGDLKKIPFPLPPPAEQERIVAKLDILFAHLEKLNHRLANIPVLLKHFRQAVLTQAVTGKLTEVWREGKENPTMYYNALNQHIKTLSKKIQSPLSLDEEKLAKSLYGTEVFKNWGIFTLEQLVDPSRGIPYGIVQTGENIKDGVPVIRCGDIKYLEILTNDLKKVLPDIHNKYKRTILKGEEVLIAIRGSVGNVAIVPDTLAGYNISREVALVPIIKSVSNKFIALLLQSPIGFRLMAEKVRGVAQKGINLSDVRRLATPLPGIEEQTEIVRRVEALFSKADRIEAQYESLKGWIDQLPQAILAKAFQGKLVPQLPTDGDARDLLAEIQQLQVELATKGKKKRKTKAKPIEAKKDINSSYPLHSILLNLKKACDKEELLRLSKLSSVQFIKQVNKEIAEGKIAGFGSPVQYKIPS